MKSLARTFIATGLLISVSGCARPPAMEHSAPPQKSSRNADDEVLEIVLTDLLTVGGSPLAVGKEKQPPKTIRFSPTPSPYPRTIDAVLMRHDEKQWAKLGETQLIAAQEAAADLVARWRAKENDPPFAPSDPRIGLTTPSTQPARLDDRPVLAWRPGFTVDRQFAVVALSIPWSIHHADATYLLARENGRWTIILRQFVYYV